jgi:hypothetical protein
MKNIIILILGLVIGAGGFWLFSREGPSSSESKENAEKSAEGAGAKEENGVFKLDEKHQAAAGIKTAQPARTEVPAEVKGYGRVLDPGPVIALKLDVDAARAALNASSKEFERVKGLYALNQNASARTLETAEAAVKRDQVQLDLAEAKFRTSLGPALAKRDDLTALMDSLGQLKWNLLRIDILSGAPEKLPESFRVAPLANEKSAFEAELVGPAPVADAAIQGQGFLGLMKTNALAPNTMIAAWFEDSAHLSEAMVIPSTALLQDGAKTVVFIQSGDETFKEIPVDARRMADGKAIVSGLAETNRVVIAGAHQILSIAKAEPAD